MLKISVTEFEKLMMINHDLEDQDYSYYQVFIKKFNSYEFKKIIFETIYLELKEQLEKYGNTKIETELITTDKEFEIKITFKEFMNKEIIIDKLEGMLYTERIIIKEIYNNILNINLENLITNYFKILQTVFNDCKNDILLNIKKMDTEVINEIFFKILVFLFNTKSIEIERAMK